jgi:hypothetical protein
VFEEVAISTAARSLVRDGYTHCRRIMPLADGSIVVKQADGASRPLTVKVSVAEEIEATELTSNTVAVKVYW